MLFAIWWVQMFLFQFIGPQISHHEGFLYLWNVHSLYANVRCFCPQIWNFKTNKFFGYSAGYNVNTVWWPVLPKICLISAPFTPCCLIYIVSIDHINSLLSFKVKEIKINNYNHESSSDMMLNAESSILRSEVPRLVYLPSEYC